MSESELVELEEEIGLSRRDLFVKGGVIAAGATVLGGPTAAAFGAANASAIKVAVVTHGDTGQFWSVFKRGVDQAKKDYKSRGVSVTQVYANNDVSKQVNGINAAIAAKAHVIATSVPDASALRGALKKASSKGILIITVNSGLGAFDSLPTYEVHVGQTEDIAGKGAGLQFKKLGAKKVLVVIHEASNSGSTASSASTRTSRSRASRRFARGRRSAPSTSAARSRRSAPGGCSSRSTSSSTCRATCRSSSPSSGGRT